MAPLEVSAIRLVERIVAEMIHKAFDEAVQRDDLFAPPLRKAPSKRSVRIVERLSRYHAVNVKGKSLLKRTRQRDAVRAALQKGYLVLTD
jgi:hypothetical protein